MNLETRKALGDLEMWLEKQDFWIDIGPTNNPYSLPSVSRYRIEKTILLSALKNARRYEEINTPDIKDFLISVEKEAQHQRARWGVEGDGGKEDADWFWLLGYLAGKAFRPESLKKQLHHIITAAASLLNWHAHKIGTYNKMRPGKDIEHETER